MATYVHHINHVAQPINIPVPPPIVRPPTILLQKRAIKQVSKQQVATRICEWCKKVILKEALLCPLCKKWRKDVAKARSFILVGLVSSILCLSLIFLICIFALLKSKDVARVPISQSQMVDYIHPGEAEAKIEPKIAAPADIKIAVEASKDSVEVNPTYLPAPLPPETEKDRLLDGAYRTTRSGTTYHFEFSLQKFLANFCGRIVILSFMGFLCSCGIFVCGVIAQNKQFKRNKMPF